MRIKHYDEYYQVGRIKTISKTDNETLCIIALYSNRIPRSFHSYSYYNSLYMWMFKGLYLYSFETTNNIHKVKYHRKMHVKRSYSNSVLYYIKKDNKIQYFELDRRWNFA